VRRLALALVALLVAAVAFGQSLTEEQKVSIGFKKVIGQDPRAKDNEFYEETAGGGINLSADRVWSEDVDSTPATCVSAGACQAYTLFTLTQDTTVNYKKGWCAASSGDCVTGTRLRDWVPPKFGSAYTLKLYDQADAQVFTTDTITWYWDYEAGYLTLDCAGTSCVIPTGFKVTAWRYVGDTLDTTLAGLGGGGPTPTPTPGWNQFLAGPTSGATPGAATWRTIVDADVPDDITIDEAANALGLEGTDLGTLTDTKACTYDLAGTEIDCATTLFTASDVPAAETDAAHDTCAEISGCVVGAITSSGTLNALSQVTSRDHDVLGGLTDDDHTQYPLLAGRSGGQTLIGGTGVSQTLTLKSTSHSTAGNIVLGKGGVSVFDEGVYPAISDDKTDKLGIGTATPDGELEVSTETYSIARSFLTTYIDDETSPKFFMRKARGTEAAITAVQTNDELGSFGFQGSILGSWTGSDAAFVRAYTTENWNGTNQGAYLAFGVVPTGDTVPSTSFFVYGTDTRSSLPMRVGSSAAPGAGYELDVTGDIRSSVSLESPLLQGGTGSGGALTVRSTSHATKGSVLGVAGDLWDLSASNLKIPATAATPHPAPTAAGQIQLNTTTRELTVGTGAANPISLNSRTLFTSTASSTVANTTTETTLIGSGVGSLTLPANYLQVGRTLRIHVLGTLDKTLASSCGNITVKLKLGSTVILSRGPAAATCAITATRPYMEVVGTCTVRSIGASGTTWCVGAMRFDSGAFQLGPTEWNMMTTAQPVTVDTTASQVVDVTWQWSVADVDNSVTGAIATLEVLN